MTNGDIKRKYDSLIREAQATVAIRDAANNLNSNVPEVRKAAREDLTNIVNGYCGAVVIKDEHPDSVATKYGLDHALVAELNSTEIFRSDSSGLVKHLKKREDKRAEEKFDEAQRENRVKKEDTKDDFHRMARSYLSITPGKTGDALFDAVANLHAQYKELTDAIEGLSNRRDDTLQRTDFVTRIAQYVGEDVKSRLTSIDINDLLDDAQKAGRDDREDYQNAIASLVGRAMQNIAEGNVETAVRLGSNLANRIRKQIEQMLPKDKRAGYVEAVLKARAEYADELFDKDKHAGDKEYAGIVHDMFEIIK